MAADRTDREALARRLLTQTGDRAQALDALRSLGFSKTDATAALEAVSPSRPAAAPAPAAGVVEGQPAPASPAAGTSAKPARASGSQRAAGGRRAAGTLPRSPRRSSRSWWSGRPTLRPPRRLSVHDVGWFGVGLLGFALVLNYVRYGPGGLTGWLSAKFVNQPYQPASEPGYGRHGHTNRIGRGDFTGTPPARHPNRLHTTKPTPAPATRPPADPPGGVIYQ